jgi:hypothetical protein
VKTVALADVPARLEEIFDDVQSGAPVLLVRGGEVVKVERVEPREFGGDVANLETMLLDAVRGPHAPWTPAELEDIAQRVRGRRVE